MNTRARTLLDAEMEAILDQLADESDYASEIEDDLEEDFHAEIPEVDGEEAEFVVAEESDADEEERPVSKEEKWRLRSFIPPVDIHFQNADKTVEVMLSPIEYFYKYVPEEMFGTLAENTNVYSVRQEGRSVNTDANEIKTLFAIHIVMGVLKFPQLRLYWNPLTRIASIAENMTRNRFEKLRNTLHVTAEERPANSTDRLWKVRPLINCIAERCRSLELEAKLCVDEQMIPFQGAINIKQYVKGKPTPWGIKAFLLCGASGIVYDLLFYQGKTTEVVNVDNKTYGLAGAVVLKLVERIPDNMNHQLYADNFFYIIATNKEIERKKYLVCWYYKKKPSQKMPPFDCKGK